MDKEPDWKLSADWQTEVCESFAVLHCAARIQPISGQQISWKRDHLEEILTQMIICNEK